MHSAAPQRDGKADGSADLPMDLDEETTVEVDVFLDQMDSSPADGSDRTNNRLELKRQITSMVAKGVKKRIRKGSQCG